jgi:hypothetical protein
MHPNVRFRTSIASAFTRNTSPVNEVHVDALGRRAQPVSLDRMAIEAKQVLFKSHGAIPHVYFPLAVL